MESRSEVIGTSCVNRLLAPAPFGSAPVQATVQFPKMTIFIILLLLLLSFQWILPGVALCQQGFQVYSVKAITNDRVLPEDDLSGLNPTEVLELSACADEYEPVSFVVHAETRLEDFLPVAGELRMGEEIIPASQVDIKLLKVWYQGCSNNIHYTYCANMGGVREVLVPELLIKDDNLVVVDTQNKINYLRVEVDGVESFVDVSHSETVLGPNEQGVDLTLPQDAVIRDAAFLQPATIEPGRNQQYWVTVYVPKGTAPGTYEGTILLTLGGTTVKELVLKVHVHRFTLEESLVESGIYYLGYITDEPPSRLGDERKTAELLGREIEDISKHGIVSPTCTQSTWPEQHFLEYMDIRNRNGLMNSLYLLWAAHYFTQPESVVILRDLAEPKGIEEFYFYGGDELTAERAEASIASWEVMHQLGGKVFSSITMEAAATVIDHLDLALVSGTRDTDFARLVHDYGQRVFSYGIPQGGEEEPDTYRRSYGIALWKSEYDGSMVYTYQKSWGSAWNDFDAYLRDHLFTYPTSDGLVGTIQWEGFREGVDDLRYLSTLLHWLEQSSGSLRAEVETWIEGISGAEDLDKVREQMARYTVRLKRQADYAKIVTSITGALFEE